jgi:ribosome-associated protein
MHALQDLGEALVALAPDKMRELALPERLADAIAQARKITRWEARRRQMQYIGRLMREVDPEPLRAQLARWSEGPLAERAQLHRVEQWRTRLVADPSALDAFCAEAPDTDRARLALLVDKARAERAQAQPPHSYRELFRSLNTLLGRHS